MTALIATCLRAEPPTRYVTRATVAVLPGNPLQTRLYSLRRAVLTRAFLAELVKDLGLTEPPQVSVTCGPGTNFTIRLFHEDPGKAIGTVNAVAAAFVLEADRRRAADREYGGLQLASPARGVTLHGRTGAEALLSVQGMEWTGKQQEQTAELMEIKRGLLLDSTFLVKCVHLAGLVSDSTSWADRMALAADVRSSLTFQVHEDSFATITLTSSDPRRTGLLGVLLSNLPKREVDLSRHIPMQDLDFIPPDIRRDFYMFNCCRAYPKTAN